MEFWEKKSTHNELEYGTTVKKLVVEEDYDARTYGAIRLHDKRASTVEDYGASW